MSKDKSKESGAPPSTGHEWDGIREYDNPLPRWWLYIFYATVVWAIGYWVLMPAWPLVSDYTRGILGHSQRRDVAVAIQAQKDARQGLGDRLASATPQQIEADPSLHEAAMAWGRSAFGDNCATCHGSGAQGFKGYPNLNDDIWLWGGTLEEIRHTITVGVRSTGEETRLSQMPAFGRDQILEPKQINDAAEYVLNLSGRSADAAAAARGAGLFAENCASCHGEDAKGKKEFGAPDLTDAEWLYGGDKTTIVETISKARNGVMPTWSGRLDAPTINALAVYVHSLGGGK
jgi:cytochrome c oxidase cbb3-type subunit 3